MELDYRVRSDGRIMEVSGDVEPWTRAADMGLIDRGSPLEAPGEQEIIERIARGAFNRGLLAADGPCGNCDSYQVTAAKEQWYGAPFAVRLTVELHRWLSYLKDEDREEATKTWQAARDAFARTVAGLINAHRYSKALAVLLKSEESVKERSTPPTEVDDDQAAASMA